MSTNRLDMVDTFDQLGHDHWKALGTKLGGVEVVKAILRGTLVVKVEIIRHLSALTSVKLTGKTINPHDFFKTRAGLWVSGYLKDVVLATASKKKVSTSEVTIGYADLVRGAKDAEISSELPRGYVFENVNTFLAQIAVLIEGQWGGKSGVLLNNGYSNIFYVKVKDGTRIVYVGWDALMRRWDYDIYRFDVVRWSVGSRVFSATID